MIDTGAGEANKQDLKSMTLSQLEELLAGMGQPKYRGRQVFRWLHQKQAMEIDQMSDIPAALREQLRKDCYINSIKIEKRLVSRVDGTVKYLYELGDGNFVESVLMRHHHGASLCISTQVGCRMGCGFCASTLAGLERNLTPGEMLDQVYAVGADSGKKVDSLVLMGIGEPLDNLDNVLGFLEILSSPEGLNMSLRHVSLSTCGLVDKIRELMAHKLPLTLSVSLHAPTDAQRSEMMPVNRRWPIEELLEACWDYFGATGRRISFEYALVDGVNDRDQDALALAELLRGRNCHVNLIPVNAVAETAYRRSKAKAVSRFQSILEQKKINATVRRELGGDISAACGQLRRDRHEI